MAQMPISIMVSSILFDLSADIDKGKAKFEDLIAIGAEGYAAVEWAVYATNRVNIGGSTAPSEFLSWGRDKLRHFETELKRLGRRNRIRVSSLYKPYYPPVSKTTDYGP